ncbi:hypothetical protein [Actinoplanes teichomyceticus]|uniref:hypothetical protein n=1 Tax=Actinoplanes teichomyceticus TaxID=1867 RepID=UPI001EF2EFB3|nr:hypothetical protein [Actinoplanes teichomyceticus]
MEQRRPGAGGVLGQAGQLLVDVAAVAQPGERVAARLLAEPLGLPAIRGRGRITAVPAMSGRRHDSSASSPVTRPADHRAPIRHSGQGNRHDSLKPINPIGNVYSSAIVTPRIRNVAASAVR